MRHPRNPFPPDDSADGPAGGAGPEDPAYAWLSDRRKAAAHGDLGSPGRTGSPPPLPRRTGDSGFRPGGSRDAENFWPLGDPADSWPLTPRPQAGPAHPGDQGGPGEPWQEAEPHEPWGQGAAEEPSVPGDGWEAADHTGPHEAGAQDGPQDGWAQDGPQDGWAQDRPQDGWAQDRPQDGWAQDGWAQAGPPAGAADADAEAPEYWDEADLQQPWEPSVPPQAGPEEGVAYQDDPHHGGPQERWLETPAEEAADAGGAAPPAGGAAPPDLPEPWLHPAGQKAPRRRLRDRRARSAPEPAGQAGPPPAGDRRVYPPMPEPDRTGPAAPATGFQDLWEPWEPPSGVAGAAREPVLNATAPYPELVRDAEYEDELWQAPGLDGPGGDEPPYPGRRRAHHARDAGRPRKNGGFLLLAGALAVAGAIPLGILGVRSLHPTGTGVKTAPLSASRAAGPGAGSGTGAAGAYNALAGPGCPAAAGAAIFPYHAPNGDGWHPGTASSPGPCGAAFSYTYLAMVPGNPSEWHDHYAWVFRTGMNNPSCSFSLYIPAAPQANSDGYYWFSAGDSNPDHRIADFTIGQASHQGQWITKGPFTFPGGTVFIEATDRGEGPPSASVAAGPARLNC